MARRSGLEMKSWNSVFKYERNRREMYCTKCGKENPDGAKFCKYCGVRMEVRVVQKEGMKKSAGSVSKKWRYLIPAGIILALVTVVIAMVPGMENLRQEKGFAEGIEAERMHLGKKGYGKVPEIKEWMQQYGMYREYYDLLLRYQEDYGIGKKCVVRQYTTFLVGLCMAKLVDFDQDGCEELLLAYADSKVYGVSAESMPQYVIEIWGHTDNGIENLFQGEGYCNGGGIRTIFLAQDEGHSYIIEGAHADFEDIYVWGFEEDEFKEIHSLNAEDLYETYMIDDVPVTLERFQEESSKWLSMCEFYGLSRDEEEEERSLEELEETLKYLQNELKINKDGQKKDDGTKGESAAGVASLSYSAVYGPFVQDVNARFSEYNLYWLYDIDKNGIKELLVQEGNSEADSIYKMYTIQGEHSVYLGEIPGSHTAFYADEEGGEKDYIIKLNAHMGGETISHISIINGSVVEEVILSRDLSEGEDYYSNSYPLESKQVNDLSLLQ